MGEREEQKPLRDFVAQFEATMQCCCDLDRWQPEPSTGHSWVCRIHRTAVGHHAAQTNGGRVEIRGVPGYGL